MLLSVLLLLLDPCSTVGIDDHGDVSCGFLAAGADVTVLLLLRRRRRPWRQLQLVAAWCCYHPRFRYVDAARCCQMMKIRF